MSNGRLLPSHTVALASVVAIGLAACSDDEPNEPAGLTATPTNGAADGDHDAAVLDAYTRYWDAYVHAVSTPDADPTPFEDLALPEVIEEELHFVEGYTAGGISRTGQPVVTDVDVQVDGAKALVLSCVDESEWVLVQNGTSVPHPDELLAPHPMVFEVHQVDDAWLVGSTVDPEGLIEC